MTQRLCRKLTQLQDRKLERCSEKKRLIINADDLGLCGSVTDAICELADIGAITSASLMPTGDDFARAAEWARVCQSRISIGVHLCLSDHMRPLTVPALQVVDLDERFVRLQDLLLMLVSGKLSRKVVREEWSAQIRRVRDSGVAPTHLDSHQHVHLLPGLRDVIVDLAKSEGLAVRHTSGPLYFQSPVCRRCGAGVAGLASAALWKSAVVNGLGRSLKRRLQRSGVPIADGCVSLSSLCSSFRGALSDDSLMLLADLVSSVDGVIEWPLHPGALDAGIRCAGARRMSRTCLAEMQVLRECRHLALMRNSGVELESYECVRHEAHEVFVGNKQ